MKAISILEHHQLSRTESRMEILELLLNKNVALSEKEIKDELSIKCDRATIYRTLNTFVKSGIAHSIINNDGPLKYVIKKAPEDHVHFKCQVCGHIMCLPQIIIDKIELPDGFTRTESNFLVIGTCKNCN
ncbi:MAG: transcriptional repressor [Bacteroidetes bacterium]|nr:transcriptional repressor [Bacteroidota bacterium]